MAIPCAGESAQKRRSLEDLAKKEEALRKARAELKAIINAQDWARFPKAWDRYEAALAAWNKANELFQIFKDKLLRCQILEIATGLANP